MKADSYLREYTKEKSKEKSERTVEAYLSDLKQFFQYFNGDIEKLTSSDIEAYKAMLLQKKLKPKTINRKLVSIRQYISFINNLNTDVTILAEIKLIKIQRQEYLDELLSMNDFERLVKAADAAGDHRALALFFGLYLTGARVSELLQLKIDINGETVTVRGKGNKYRYVFLPDRLSEYIKPYLKVRHDSKTDFLFINDRNGNPMDRQSVHNIIKKYAGISKVKLAKAHAHNFRHLYAFRLIEEGFSIDEVADFLGHADINTTRIYTRKSKSELMKSIKKL